MSTPRAYVESMKRVSAAGIHAEMTVSEAIDSCHRRCGHTALGCSNQTTPCCDQCDHATYWNAIDAFNRAKREATP